MRVDLSRPQLTSGSVGIAGRIQAMALRDRPRQCRLCGQGQEGANVMTVASFRLKDPLEWTPSEVGDFLASILPGHTCLNYFQHTSGYVLCSLEKEDLRKQTKNDEAKRPCFQRLLVIHNDGRAIRTDDSPNCREGLMISRSSMLTLYVKAPRQAQLSTRLCRSMAQHGAAWRSAGSGLGAGTGSDGHHRFLKGWSCAGAALLELLGLGRTCELI
eukprot:Skav212358  [mRNA]  locus=scaffold3038:72730:75282:+ [translate_table: standard]